MSEFWSSCSKWFNEKTSSPLYFTYIGFFIIWNWEVFQVIFLESAELFIFPRIEYIFTLQKSFFLSPSLIFSFLNWFFNFLLDVLPPAVLTFVAIKWFPVLQKWSLVEYLKYRFERKRMFYEKQKEHDNWVLSREKERNVTLQNIAQVKEEQKKTEEELKETMTDEEQWELEYEEFSKNNLTSELKKILDIVYKNRGSITNEFGKDIVGAKTLATTDTYDITAYVENSRSQIFLTPKGKFFAKLYLKTNPIF